MSDISISNVIQISVSTAPQGVGSYNVNNIALFTREVPVSPFAEGYKIYKSASAVAEDFGSSSIATTMAISVFSQSPNILTGNGYLVIIPMLTSPSAETLKNAIIRSEPLVQFSGIMIDEVSSDSDLLEAAQYVQTTQKILFTVKTVTTAVDPSEIFSDIQDAGLTQTRCLLYTVSETTALQMMSAYASRALSIDFTGSNTTATMHLKDLIGINADSGITETILEKCKTVGADTYLSIQGISKVFCTGANSFFDQVYNLIWFAGALQVAGFNALAQVSTKVPQTEQGVEVLKGAYRSICEQGIINNYIAPGAWTSPDTFGNQADFIRNIAERGYYIYSLPVGKQTSADRVARKAPLIQIAVKESGAIQSSSVIVYINA